MTLDFEPTPLQHSGAELSAPLKVTNTEGLLDVPHDIEGDDRDWELTRDRATAREELVNIFEGSQGRVEERKVDHENEQRLALPIVLRAYRNNAQETNYVNPDMADAA
jgi:hypothetical protein